MEPRFEGIGENQYRSNIFSYELPTPSRKISLTIWNFAVPTGFLKKDRVMEAASSSDSEEAIRLAVFDRIVLRAQKCFSLHFFCKIKFIFWSFSFFRILDLVVSHFWTKMAWKFESRSTTVPVRDLERRISGLGRVVPGIKLFLFDHKRHVKRLPHTLPRLLILLFRSRTGIVIDRILIFAAILVQKFETTKSQNYENVKLREKNFHL